MTSQAPPEPTFRSSRRKLAGPSPSAELRTSVTDALAEARRVMGPDVPTESVDASDSGRAAELIGSLTWLAMERLQAERPPTKTQTGKLCRLIVHLQQLGRGLYRNELANRARRLAACDASLARLRAIPTSQDLTERVCVELVESCGFERALLSCVADGSWKPWQAHFPEDATGWLTEWLGATIPLDEMTLETSLLTRQQPALIHDTSSNDRVHRIVVSGGSNSYVVAPMVSDGTVVGFMHADHNGGGYVTETDRDILWAFVEGFRHIYERTAMLERLHEQRTEVHDTLRTTATLMDEVCDAEIELARRSDAGSAVTRSALSLLSFSTTALDELTSREHEVLALMVAGATNGVIAEKLVITEGTVKSHVKHILRKLGAANRSQAIAHYIGMANDL